MPAEAPLLHILVYISREAGPMSRAELLGLLGQSRPANAARGITGLLVHKAGHFLQILEGPKSEVDGLMEKIQRDTRHTDVAVLLRENLSARRFGSWSMALADWPDEDAATTASWSALLQEFRTSGGRLGPSSMLVDFALSLARSGYLGGE